jgi:NADH-quinone oxidoreductase subunit H
VILTPALIAAMQAGSPQEPAASMTVFLLASAVKLLLVFTVYMLGVAYLTLAERKISAWIQDRHGPNRVGWHGLLQPIADGLKNIMKEETYPGGANRTMYVLAPMLAFVVALVTWAVIPFGAPLPTPWGRIDLVVADMPIGFLFVLAISSLGVYGIVLAGWASNNKYALLGGLRASAQMISYEISMAMATLPVILLAGNVALGDIVRTQAVMGWNVFLLSVASFVFLVAAFAETNRLPFDLPEAESELIAGYHTEYSAMKFSLFFIAEYANMVTASALIVTLFFGGWDIPFWTRDNFGPYAWWISLVTILAFAVKVVFFLFLYMWIRWTLPRFRYDQLMGLGWKFMLPVIIAYIVIISGAILALDAIGLQRTGMYGLALFGLNVVLVVILFVIMDRGRIIQPASARLREDQVARLRGVSARSPLSSRIGA